MIKNAEEKLLQLEEITGQDRMELFENGTFDSVVAGICRHPSCEYTFDIEPDCVDGWCEECCDNSVVSALILGGII